MQEIVDEKIETNRAKSGSLRNTSIDLKQETSVILKNHASTPVRKEGLSPTSKAIKEAIRNMFVKKCAMSDRVESLRESNRCKNRPRVRIGFVPKWTEKET